MHYKTSLKARVIRHNIHQPYAITSPHVPSNVLYVDETKTLNKRMYFPLMAVSILNIQQASKKELKGRATFSLIIVHQSITFISPNVC